MSPHVDSRRSGWVRTEWLQGIHIALTILSLFLCPSWALPAERPRACPSHPLPGFELLSINGLLGYVISQQLPVAKQLTYLHSGFANAFQCPEGIFYFA